MKINHSRQFTQVAVFTLLSFIASTVFAQTAERPRRPPPENTKDCVDSCSNPVNIKIVKNSGPTNALASDFRPAPTILNNSPYNGTQPNKFFTDTLRWKMPVRTSCELKGTVTFKLKNLGTSLVGNDTFAIVSEGGDAIPGFSVPVGLWTSSQGAGATRTLSFPLTSGMMKLGRLSFVLQDDTAVQEVTLDIVGCCIEPN